MWQHVKWQLHSHGFLKLVIPENEQIPLREAPANISWETLAWNTSTCKPVCLDYCITHWPDLRLRPSQKGSASRVSSLDHYTLSWRGTAYERKVCRAKIYCSLLKRNSLDRTGKKVTQSINNNLGKSMNLGCSQVAEYWNLRTGMYIINHHIKQKIAPFFKWGENETQRFKQLARKGQGTNLDLDMFDSKSCVLYTTAHYEPGRGQTRSVGWDRERWALGGHVPWEPCSEGRMASGWETAPALATRVLHSYQLSSWEILHMSQGQFPLSRKEKRPGSCSPNLLTMRENCLVLCHRNHRRKLNQEGRAHGAWN